MTAAFAVVVINRFLSAERLVERVVDWVRKVV
jgi:hypothetical protein